MKGNSIVKTYILDVKENIFVKEDVSKSCLDYPTQFHQTYGDCDDEFLDTVVPHNMKAIGQVDDYNQASTFAIAEMPLIYNDLFDGTEKSPCPLPCSTYSFESRFLKRNPTDYLNDSYVEISFPSSMTVTSTFFLKFSFTNTLSSIGGSMGLWLGLSLLEALQVLLELALVFIKTS